MSTGDLTLWIFMAVAFSTASLFLAVKSNKRLLKVRELIATQDSQEFLSGVRDLVVEYNKGISASMGRNKRLRGHILNKDTLEELQEKQGLAEDEVYEAFNDNLLMPVLITSLAMEVRFKYIGLVLLLIVILIIGALSLFGLRLPANYPWIFLFAYGAPVSFIFVTYVTQKQGLRTYKELKRDFARRIDREALATEYSKIQT